MNKALLAGIGTAVLTTAASAEITGAVAVSYSKTVEDFGGASTNLGITDIYLTSNDAADVALNVFDMNLGSAAPASYWQSATGAGWLPNNLGSIFDTQALREGDSFVTIGGFGADGFQGPGAGQGTGLDPNFGGNSASAPGALAGWFNSSPPNVNGSVQALDAIGGGLGVLIGRFSVANSDAPDMIGTDMSVTWNQGLGTGGQQGSFSVAAVPAPGALALMGLAGLAGRRRRG